MEYIIFAAIIMLGFAVNRWERSIQLRREKTEIPYRAPDWHKERYQ